MPEEHGVSRSPVLTLLISLKQVVLSRASPIADAILFFFLVFLLSVAGHTFQDVYGTRQLSDTFKHRLVEVLDERTVASRWPTKSSRNHVYFRDISTHTNFWNYLQYNLPDIIYPEQYYDGGKIPDDQSKLIMGHNIMVQKVRLRQKRVKYRDCQDLPSRLQTEELGLKTHKCYPKYSDSVENKDSFKGSEWISSEILALRPRNPLQYKFQGGSYSIELPTNNADFKKRIEELKESKWTDQATRVVFVDFCVLNLPRDQFVSVRYEFDFTEYGKIVPSIDIRAYKDRLSHDLAVDATNYISEFALYGLVAVNAFRELGRFRVVGPSIYLSNIWNLVMCGIVACLFTSLYYRVAVVRSQWSTIQSKSSTDLKWNIDGSGQYNIKWDWDDLGENDALIVKLQAIGIVLAYLRMFAFLQFFSKRVDDFITSLSHSKGRLVSYWVIMLIFICAFSVGLHLAFGIMEYKYSSLPLSALALTELLFGNLDSQPFSADQGIVVSLFLLGFFGMLALVTMSAILALVNWAAREVTRGNVHRETDDLDANLKYQLSAGVKRLLMSEYLGSLGRGLRSLVLEKPKDLDFVDDDFNEDALEQDIQLSMINSSKFAIKSLLGSVVVLRDSVCHLCESMGVDFHDDNQHWRRDNWWRKFRNEYQDTLFKQLLNAIKSGEPDIVSEVIDEWRRIERSSVDGQKTNIDWRDHEGFSGLHYASLAGDADLVNRLIALKADPGARNDDGNSCVHLAALAGRINALRVLIEIGYADFDEVVNNATFTPFHMAAYGGHTSICKYFGEELQANILCQTSEGLTPLHLAVIQRQDETTEYLAKRFPEALTARANGGETPMHLAVLTHSNVQLVRVLLQNGAKVAEKMFDGQNVYQVALAAKCEPAVLRVLHRVLSMGDNYMRAFPGLDERASGLSLIKFASLGMLTEMEHMISQGADIDFVQPGAGTALHTAVKGRSTNTIEFLVDSGANVTIKDTEGFDAVQLAVIDGFYDGYEMMANSLTFEKLPIDVHGNTLLHLAVSAGKSLQIVQHLVSHHKVDPMSRNFQGQTCVDLAHQAMFINSAIKNKDANEQMGSPSKLEELEPRRRRRYALAVQDQIVYYFEQGKDEYEDSVRQPILPGQTVEVRAKGPDISNRIVRFFENIGLQKDARAYARLLAENEVDFDGLVLLQDAHLRELGIVKLGVRNKILFGIAAMQSKRRALQAALGEGGEAQSNIDALASI